MKTYLLPGASAKPLSKRYGIEGEDLIMWTEEGLNDMTLHDLYSTLDKIITEDCILIGKSFGGYVALTYENKHVKKRILLGPIANVGPKPGRGKLGTVDIKKMGIGKVMHVPTKIIHGIDDTTMPIAEIRKIAKEIGAELIEVPGGHSLEKLPKL